MLQPRRHTAEQADINRVLSSTGSSTGGAGPPGHGAPKSARPALPGTSLWPACSVSQPVHPQLVGGAVCNLPHVFANLRTSKASKFMAFVVFQDNYI